jgi:hypothetical protein
MGEAKKRGSQDLRIEVAKAKIEALKPAVIVCNFCKNNITDIDVMDSRGLNGIEAIFSGSCNCGHRTLAVKGDPEAVADVVMAFEESMGQEAIIGTQPIVK